MSQSKSRIAYLTGEYPKVSHTFIQREIAALRAQGHDIVTCTIRRAPPKDVVGEDQKAEERATWPVLAHAKKPLHLLGAHASALRHAPGKWFSALRLAWRTRAPGPKAALYQLFYFLEAGVLARHLRQQGVTHLHNHFANSSCSVAMLTTEMSGIPFSFTMHGPAIFFEPMRWRLDEKLSRAAFVACISHFCRSQAMYFSDREHWDRYRIVHCGVEPARYGADQRQHYGKRVMFVGRLDAVKGVPLLLDAFAGVIAKHPDAHLSIIGDGPDRAALEAQASLGGLTDRVTFLGYRPQDEVAGLLQTADMLVLPSFAEGVPVVLMEAMASRIPVIASQVAGVAELVSDGESGFVIPAGDLETLTERLDRLLSDPALCARMGAAGRAKVEADFDIEKEAGWLGTIFAASAESRLPATLRPSQKD